MQEVPVRTTMQSNSFHVVSHTTQYVGDVGAIEVDGDEITDVSSLFPVIFYHRVDLHLHSIQYTRIKLIQHMALCTCDINTSVGLSTCEASCDHLVINCRAILSILKQNSWLLLPLLMLLLQFLPCCIVCNAVFRWASVHLSVHLSNAWIDKTKAPSERSSIMTNRKLPTSFPMSLRWTAYVAIND